MAAEEVRVCRRAPVAIKQEQDDDSDAEEPNLGPKKSEGQIIHSGHFMVSSPHTASPPKKGYDFDTVNMQTCQTYCFGKTSTSHFSIDASLTKLFECMTLAYSEFQTPPPSTKESKWGRLSSDYSREGQPCFFKKQCETEQLTCRTPGHDPGRACQCEKGLSKVFTFEEAQKALGPYFPDVERRDNPVCHFVTPLDGSVDMEDHRRPEDDEVGAWRANRKGRDTPVPMEQDIDIEMLMSEFTDTLFSTLASHQPVAWPNPREIAHAGNADMIQPGLIPLQPNLDFMDTFEPFQAGAARVPAPPSSPPQTVQPTAVPQNGAGGVTQASFPSAETPKFGFSSTLQSSVITHTASGQSPSLILTTRPQAGPCDASVMPHFQPQPSAPAQTFALPKPVQLKGTRAKPLQKIVPAPTPLVFKNAFIAPASFPGQTSAVIVTPAPLKSEGVSPPSVVLAPTAIGRNPGVTEFHILQPTVTSQHLIIAKDEPGSSTNCRAQTPSPTSTHAGNADMIQPGLIPLQPNLDFMDTFEPFQVSSMASSNCPTQTSILTSPISSASLRQEPIPPPVTPALSNTSNKNCSSAVNAFGQTAEFRSQTPLANQQTFLPVFPPLVPSVPCAAGAARVPAPPSSPPQTVQPTAVPQNGAGGVTQASFPSAETPKFGFSSTLQSSVITHTASGQSPSLILTTRPQAGPCDASVMPHFQPQPSAPAQTFALPKPVQLKGTRAKPLQKIVPAPTPLVFKNAFIAPASFPGQTSAVIVTPAPLKSEGVSPPSVVLAPTAIGRNPGVTEFHILQPTVTSQHLIIAKDEPGSSTNCRAQTPSPTSNRERHNSGQGSLCTSEQIPDPQSSQNSSTSKSKTDSCIVGFKSRRINHISAEQKRRFNIKIGFDTLNTLVPVLKSQSNSKPISNAATLQKTVEYIAKLQQERAQMQEESKRLKDEIDTLNTSINCCQQQLPATGVPITRQRFDHMREMFDDYVKNRTLQNWKFWIFSIIIKPLFESFNGMVSTTSLDDMCNTTLSWLDEHCPLPVLRPMVLRTLRQLSTTTSILSDPSLLPEQATQAVRRMNNRSGES
ncbi:UNVERIFIED_CONTAM: hypothetical protein FKN15_011296 [Acipenser sinensis]